jgi:hypothetical protein
MLCTHQALNSLCAILFFHLTLHNTASPMFRIPQILGMGDQIVAEASTYTSHNKHNRRTFMSGAAFEPAIPAFKWPQTYP